MFVMRIHYDNFWTTFVYKKIYFVITVMITVAMIIGCKQHNLS
jgi:hypothetical protein